MSHSDKYFELQNSIEKLGARTLRGGAFTMLGQASKIFLQMVGTVLLARLLSPDDFGLVGMMTIVINFVSIFKDLGLSRATLQRPEISRPQISNLFWINMAVSIIIGGVVVLLSGPIAAFYGRDELYQIAIVLGLLLALQGFGIQHRALMARGMEFAQLAVINTASQFTGLVLALAIAWKGGGYWALVVLLTIPSFFDGVLCIVYSRWVPGFPALNVGTKPFLKYGVNALGFSMTNYFSRNLDRVLIGKYLGAVHLGLYNMSYNLLLLPMQQINAPLSRPVIVALAKFQYDAPRYRDAYRKAIMFVATGTIPIVLFLAGEAELILVTLVGDKWSGSAEIFLALSPMAYVAATNVGTGWVYASLGHTDRQFRQGIVTSIMMTCSIIIGMQWGVLGVAMAASLATCVLRIPQVAYCFRDTPLRVVDFLKGTFLPTCYALLSLLLAKLGTKAVGIESNSYAHLILYSALFVLSYATLNLCDRREGSAFRSMLPYLKNYISSRYQFK